MTSKDKWVWMPHPGHFICGMNCRFRLNTCVGKYIVSTVGELWLERGAREIHAKIHNPDWYYKNQLLKGDEFDNAYMKQFGYEDVGYGRKYETMVFLAKKSENKCCPFEMVTPSDVDCMGYNTPEEAYGGHMKMCLKWSKK